MTPTTRKQKSTLDPRAMMELAVKVMRQSVTEPRSDGKPIPKVGVVLVKPDGTVETACRGELRFGDHAEFTLLERKNRSNKLDGSLLFATLEPCAPHARTHPKLGCAERIVNARMKEVWVGIEDPDPTVDRKGIKFLQDHGIIVHMFDRDLQEIIQAENTEFIASALERAQAARDAKPKEVILSVLEGPTATTVFEDLSEEALARYRAIARIPERARSLEFQQRLETQGFLAARDQALVPTGFGLLLFGKEPRLALPQAGVLATIRDASGSDEIRDFDGPMVLIPEALEQWLGARLPQIIDRSTMRRTTTPAFPFEMIRESVVNALVHRDYDIREAKVQVVVTPDAITVRSPGRPVAPITLAHMQSFSAPMLSRNPALHYVFARMDMAEERGLGLRSLRDRATSLGLPIPRFAWEDPYLALTLFRNRAGATSALSPEALAALTASERKGWEWVATEGKARARDYARAMSHDVRTARRHLNGFLRLGLVEKVGSGPATEYRVV